MTDTGTGQQTRYRIRIRIRPDVNQIRQQTAIGNSNMYSRTASCNSNRTRPDASKPDDSIQIQMTRTGRDTDQINRPDTRNITDNRLGNQMLHAYITIHAVIQRL